jgi:hypothetical protein
MTRTIKLRSFVQSDLLPVAFPQPEPGIIGELLVVLLIGGNAIRRSEGPRIRQRKDALQGLDLGDDLVYVHTAVC